MTKVHDLLEMKKLSDSLVGPHPQGKQKPLRLFYTYTGMSKNENGVSYFMNNEVLTVANLHRLLSELFNVPENETIMITATLPSKLPLYDQFYYSLISENGSSHEELSPKNLKEYKEKIQKLKHEADLLYTDAKTPSDKKNNRLLDQHPSLHQTLNATLTMPNDVIQIITGYLTTCRYLIVNLNVNISAVEHGSCNFDDCFTLMHMLLESISDIIYDPKTKSLGIFLNDLSNKDPWFNSLSDTKRSLQRRAPKNWLGYCTHREIIVTIDPDNRIKGILVPSLNNLRYIDLSCLYHAKDKEFHAPNVLNEIVFKILRELKMFPNRDCGLLLELPPVSYKEKIAMKYLLDLNVNHKKIVSAEDTLDKIITCAMEAKKSSIFAKTLSLFYSSKGHTIKEVILTLLGKKEDWFEAQTKESLKEALLEFAGLQYVASKLSSTPMLPKIGQK
jgi:hypothetical protein